jgi:polar amino acid transport system substrate-binding protein
LERLPYWRSPRPAAAGLEEIAASTSSGCSVDQLNLVHKGQLTIGTDNPAFPALVGGTPPKGSMWKVSDPNSGQGFESAVAYAVAGKLGFKKSDVHWVVVPFEQSFKPGSKSFDFDVNQVSFTPARANSVDFSDSYYDVNQALIGLKGTPITSAKTIADVKQVQARRSDRHDELRLRDRRTSSRASSRPSTTPRATSTPA